MAAGQVPPLGLWAAVVLALAIVVYMLYQVSGFARLGSRWRRLIELKAGQRYLYRDLEALQLRAEGLLARVPPAQRPVPFAGEDERAIALAAGLRAGLARLCDGLRPLDPGPRPTPNPLRLLVGSHWRRLKILEDELRFGEAQRSSLERTEALASELAVILAALARKPLELQLSLAELQAMAETLGDDIAAEERRGTAGLVSLAYEVQALRKSAMEWAERLRSSSEQEVAQVAVEAEALRGLLTVRLWELLERAQHVIGVHDQALGWQHKLERALSAAEAELAKLRPANAAALQPEAAALRNEQVALSRHYDAHRVDAYQEVVQQSWSLTARARTLAGRVRRLCQAESTVAEAVAVCEQAADGLAQDVAEEQRQSGVELDLCRAFLERAQRALAELQQEWAAEPEAGRPADEETALAKLCRVEELATACREVQEACRRSLAAWVAQRKRIEEVLERLEDSAAEHQRLRRGWQQLRGYDPRNWPQVDPGWYDRYLSERQAILAAAAELRAALTAGRVAESGGSDLRHRCELLDQRWQALLHEGQGLRMVLHRALTAERQVLEGVRALRADMEAVAATLAEVPDGMPSLAKLAQLCRQVGEAYSALGDEARHPERADFGHLRDVVLPDVKAQLEACRTCRSKTIEREWAALKLRVTKLWEEWESLATRLAKAVPASEVDQELPQRRLQALLQATREAPAGLKQALDLAAEAETLVGEIEQAQATFQAEREAVHAAEQRLALERRKAVQLRDHLPDLLRRAHPQIVDEEWERSTKAWSKAEGLLRQLEPQSGTQAYVARLEEAAVLYGDVHARARSALVRLVRYAYLEDPEGMRTACLPLGRHWGRLGVTARERQIGDLLGEVERAGQVERLLQHLGEHFRSGQ